MVNRYALTIGNREIVGSNVKFSLHHATVKMDWTIETDYAKAIAIIKPNHYLETIFSIFRQYFPAIIVLIFLNEAQMSERLPRISYD